MQFPYLEFSDFNFKKNVHPSKKPCDIATLHLLVCVQSAFRKWSSLKEGQNSLGVANTRPSVRQSQHTSFQPSVHLRFCPSVRRHNEMGSLWMQLFLYRHTKINWLLLLLQCYKHWDNNRLGFQCGFSQGR